MVALSAKGYTQTAQEIVDKTAKVYAEARTFSGQASTREVMAILLPSDTDTPRYEVRSVQYRRLQVKLRRSDEWQVISQNVYGRGGSSNEGGVPSERVQVSILMKSGSGAPKQIFYTAPKPTTREVPAEQFAELLDSLLGARGYGSRNEPDMVFKNFRASSGSIALGLVNPQSKDAAANGEAYCIEAQTTNGQAVTLWIDKATFLIRRVVVQSVRFFGGYGGPRPPGSVVQGPSSNMVSLSETLYVQKINPLLATGDFLNIPAGLDKLMVDQLGFGPMSDLVNLAVVPSASNPGQPAAVVAPAPAQPLASPVVAEEQVLSTEQMEGIVLIEGDAGTATGFMTKMRGVDFVVTNQHVLGENKKITLKNLRGEVVPVQAIFGAVGSDIAILRMPTAQGALKVADDVFKSVKIGDKIVVVGNRLGGGVATQTSGQVLGVGPTRIEVNANFEPGNSGSPIFSTNTQEVVGVATYAETRKVAVEESGAQSRYGEAGQSTGAKVEKRWFGYRLDSVTKWESIDLAKWHAQGERVGKFKEVSDAFVALVRFNFKKAALNERLAPIIAEFQNKAAQRGTNQLGVAGDVKSLFTVTRSLAESGLREFEAAEYYDYYRTCLYWDESVPMQVDYRKAIIEVLKKYESNSEAFVFRMRNGGGN